MTAAAKVRAASRASACTFDPFERHRFAFFGLFPASARLHGLQCIWLFAHPLPADAPLFDTAVFEEEEDPANKSFFSEIISSISDVRFSNDGVWMQALCARGSSWMPASPHA